MLMLKKPFTSITTSMNGCADAIIASVSIGKTRTLFRDIIKRGHEP